MLYASGFLVLMFLVALPQMLLDHEVHAAARQECRAALYDHFDTLTSLSPPSADVVSASLNNPSGSVDLGELYSACVPLLVPDAAPRWEELPMTQAYDWARAMAQKALAPTPSHSTVWAAGLGGWQLPTNY